MGLVVSGMEPVLVFSLVTWSVPQSQNNPSQEKGVGVINASPLSMGLLTEQGPPAWHPASDEIKVRALLPSIASYQVLKECLFAV